MKREASPFESRQSLSALGASVRAALGGEIPVPPAGRALEEAMGAAGGREKLWRLDSVFHCSVIGTCIGTAELRKLVGRITKNALTGTSDHDVHHEAVGAASDAAQGGRILHKALDQLHAACIRRFDQVRSEAELMALWETVKQEGDIPGGYWAVMTHRLATMNTRKRAFGDVHMLSHLVGAANRADIRRLAKLEADNAGLVEKVERQQQRLSEAIVQRDETIRRLSGELASRAAESPPVRCVAEVGPSDEESGSLRELVQSLERKLGRETVRRERADRRAGAAEAQVTQLQSRLAAVAQELESLKLEVEAFDARLATAAGLDDAVDLATRTLIGRVVLYVGGRQGTATSIGKLVQKWGGTFLYHDGGVEDRRGKVVADVHRADLVFFPVDCISHDATNLVKRACEATGKRYHPLRSSGLTCFMAALAAAVDSAAELHEATGSHAR